MWLVQSAEPFLAFWLLTTSFTYTVFRTFSGACAQCWTEWRSRMVCAEWVQSDSEEAERVLNFCFNDSVPLCPHSFPFLFKIHVHVFTHANRRFIEPFALIDIATITSAVKLPRSETQSLFLFASALFSGDTMCPLCKPCRNTSRWASQGQTRLLPQASRVLQGLTGLSIFNSSTTPSGKR